MTRVHMFKQEKGTCVTSTVSVYISQEVMNLCVRLKGLIVAHITGRRHQEVADKLLNNGE